MSVKDFEECIPDAMEKAQYWLWLKKSGKEKIFEAFNEVRDKLN